MLFSGGVPCGGSVGGGGGTSRISLVKDVQLRQQLVPEGHLVLLVILVDLARLQRRVCGGREGEATPARRILGEEGQPVGMRHLELVSYSI